MATPLVAVNPAYLKLLSTMTPSEIEAEIAALEKEMSEISKARVQYSGPYWVDASCWGSLEREMLDEKNSRYFHSATIAIKRQWEALMARLWAAFDQADKLGILEKP